MKKILILGAVVGIVMIFLAFYMAQTNLEVNEPYEYNDNLTYLENLFAQDEVKYEIDQKQVRNKYLLGGALVFIIAFTTIMLKGGKE